MAGIFTDVSQLEEIASYVFLGADTDGSGFIEGKELHEYNVKIAKEIGKPEPTEADTEEALKKYDENGDGKLNLDEFKEFVKFVFSEQ